MLAGFISCLDPGAGDTGSPAADASSATEASRNLPRAGITVVILSPLSHPPAAARSTMTGAARSRNVFRVCSASNWDVERSVPEDAPGPARTQPLVRSAGKLSGCGWAFASTAAPSPSPRSKSINRCCGVAFNSVRSTELLFVSSSMRFVVSDSSRWPHGV